MFQEGYKYDNCSYAAIQKSPETMAQKCQTVAHGVCQPSNNYLNLYSLYYCHMGGSNWLYIAFTIVAVIWLLTMLNYIRRTFFVPPLMKLRKTLGISSNMTEKIILPLSFGIVPFIVRVQGAYQNLDFEFNLGATLGGMFAILGFSFGVCSLVIGRSKKVKQGMLNFDVVFGLVACGIIWSFANSKFIHLWHGVIMIGVWIVYAVGGYFMEKEEESRKI